MHLTTTPTGRKVDLSPSRLTGLGATVVVIVVLALIFQLDRVTGAAPVQHLYYLPIIFGAIRGGTVAGLGLSACAIVLYHTANPGLLTSVYQESDLVQIVLFLATGIVTARLADNARRLHLLATTDDLTGLHNLRSFESRFSTLIRTCRETSEPLAMLVLDLDRLKALNDEHGHLTGAEAVRTIGHALAAHLPADAVACRYGGDEFVVALPSCKETTAQEIAEDLRRRVKALAPSLAGQSFPVGTLSISIGVACLHPVPGTASASGGETDGQIGESLFRAADRGLYAAKEQGRDRVSVSRASSVPRMRSARDRSH